MHKLTVISHSILISLSVLAGTVNAQSDVIEQTSAANANEVALSSLAERFEVGEELIVTMRVGQFNYGEVFAVVTERGLFVSAEEVISVLDFPIKRVATDRPLELDGWYISEDRSFNLQLFDEVRSEGVGRVIRSGDTTFITPEQFAVINGENLIDFDLVGSWFGLTLSFDSERLSVNAKASIPLPAQSKLKREKASLNEKQHRIPNYPNFDFGYYERSHQMFDATLTSRYINDEFSHFYSLIGIQDLLGYSTRFFVSGNEEDILRNANINFKRQSLKEDLLGPLNASTVQFGDIRPTRVGGVTGAQSIGVNVSNRRLGQPFDFEFTEITGLIQDGWDVELYQNGVLTRKILNTGGGQYEFLDLPLFANLNRFEVVKYGPQGQVERERFERNLDADIFNQRIRYDVSLTKSNTSLLNETTVPSDSQDLFLTGAYSYSFLGWLSTRFSHNVNLTDSEGLYSLGATARLSPRLLSSVAVTSFNSRKHAISANLRSLLFDQNLSLNISRTIDEDFGDSNNASLEMNGNLLQSDFGRLSYGNSLSFQNQSNGNANVNLNNTLTFSSRFGFISHNYSFQNTKASGTSFDTQAGGVTLGLSTGNLVSRLNANYEIDSNTSTLNWTGAEASLNYEFYNNLSTRLKVNRVFDTGFNNYQWSLQWQQPSYALFGSVTHNSNDDVSVSLNARFSMSEAPFGKGYVSTNLPLTSTGLVAVRLYEDVNQNFVFDSEDRVLPNVKVSADQLIRFAESDEFGIALFEGISSFEKSDLTVDLESLDDPYLLQSTENTSLTTREGLLTLVNYPFVQGIEFEGNILNKSADGSRVSGLRNAPVKIYRRNGEYVKTVKTEFDGYFYSGLLHPGVYTLVIAEEYVSENGLETLPNIIVKANRAGGFVPDIQILTSTLPFVERYQAYIASFTSKLSAKAYINLMTRGPKKQAFNLTISHNRANDKYLVGAALFERQELAEAFCLAQKNNFPNCNIRKDKFLLDNIN
ncbi:hypothetical protein ISG33_03220 [Glaciecola sp. MH2013]|uniref:hypothetical protein n=1 Tax=Glaciecola sp. MH2013 TaxID=2785524 RepID=UPI00189EB358|nr:hypothetical protein [Glaciecola sp. MH2013]MBF7072412.1 hypothetical protein [Glaciecola sp. MH2013]